MKTISGNSISTKEISLSKAAKILSKFVSAENGASKVISAYLHRACTSFNELNQLHKELKSSCFHKKQKRHRTEIHDDTGSVETNQELNHGHVQSNKFGRHQFGSENTYADDEKLTQTVVKSGLEPNGLVGCDSGYVGGREKHNKNRKKKQEVESRYDEDSRVKFGESEGEGTLLTRAQNEIQSGQELVEGDDSTGMEGKKQKREDDEKKKDREDKEGTCNFSSGKGDVENPEGDSAMGSEHQKEIEKKLKNSVEVDNGGLVDPQDLQIKKKTKNESWYENTSSAEEVKMVQKKRKNEDVEGKSGDMTTKRMKRKREVDH